MPERKQPAYLIWFRLNEELLILGIWTALSMAFGAFVAYCLLSLP